MSEPQPRTWSVRGVPTELIERVNVVAKLNAMTLGVWVTQVLQEAVDRFDEAGALQEQRELRVRLHHLEAEVRRLDKENQARFDDVMLRLATLEPQPVEVRPIDSAPAATKASDHDPKHEDWSEGW